MPRPSCKRANRLGGDFGGHNKPSKVVKPKKKHKSRQQMLDEI